MKDVKKKAKQFWEDHKETIVVSCVGSIAVGYLAFFKGYGAGYVDGGMEGFHWTMNWFDKTFPNESKAKELWDTYQKLHPDEIVHQKGLGKWS